MLLIDDSLSLINRTGAHFIARELVAEFGGGATVRRWRLMNKAMPEGIPRKIAARLMLKELIHMRDSGALQWPEPRNTTRRLFLDPLYVLRSRLTSNDIVLCHDIGPITHTDLYDATTVAMYQTAYARIKSTAPRMIFVSETSRHEFERHYGSNYPLLHAIPLFIRPSATTGQDEPIPKIGSSYFLSVGALERRKNHSATIEAFKQSGLAARGVQLVVCGSRGDATAQITDLAATTPGVVMPGYVTDAQLRWLYRNAKAFVLPSLLEGFGMPALEAAQYGLPCVISQDSALNEAIGGLGLTVSIESTEEIANKMHEVLDMPNAQRKLISKNLKYYSARFTREIFLSRWQHAVST
jgi:glycosyltransferase involved in cell wall biosynthesis